MKTLHEIIMKSKQANKTKPREHVRAGGGTFSSKKVCQEKGENVKYISLYYKPGGLLFWSSCCFSSIVTIFCFFFYYDDDDKPT